MKLNLIAVLAVSSILSLTACEKKAEEKAAKTEETQAPVAAPAEQAPATTEAPAEQAPAAPAEPKTEETK